MKNRYVKIITLIFAALLTAQIRDAIDTMVITDFPSNSLHNVEKKFMPDNTSGYFINNINYSNVKDTLLTDLLLKFDKESDKYIKDDSKKYNIYSANYQFVKNGIGAGSASFFKSDHVVMINSSEGLWLGNFEDLGSFNIEFRFKPAELKNGSTLFSIIGYFSGVKKGIDIVIKNQNVYVYLYNMFRATDGKLNSASLAKGSKIKTGEWYHFSLSFDRKSGKLTKIINGNEEDVVYMTATGKAFSDVYTPLFGYVDDTDGAHKGSDLPFAVIGKNYKGLIDEFRISYKSYSELKNSTDIAVSKYKGSEYEGRIPYNREGIITSPVTQLPSTGTAITDFSWEEIINPGTFIWMEFRIADKFFDEKDDTLKWYKINTKQKNIYRTKDENGDFLYGKYFQWRAHLVASPEGYNSPVLKKITVKYRVNRPPVIPLFFEVAEAGDKYITLRWKKNVEADLGGYRIYYGTKKGSYDGIISVIDGAKINNKTVKGDYVYVKIDNSVIEENKNFDTRNVLLYPYIKNTVLYYFAVTAYDTYKEGTVYNHESDLSSYIEARPFAGSDIKPEL
ncbi:MAG: LamG domain-containing protein [Spirochaetes bacterium]|nr:LamG domain-containing protein [Spirochaetota bacterium]